MRKVILMVGPPGSGKTTYAKKCYPTSTRISQDEKGRFAHFEEFMEALEEGDELIVVDRMNFSRAQRERYIKPAKEHGYEVDVYEIPYEEEHHELLKSRIVEREDHPTIAKGEATVAVAVLMFYKSQFQPVDCVSEGISKHYTVPMVIG